MSAEQSFNDVFSPTPGFRVTDIILLSYSMNPEVLNEILVETGLVDILSQAGTISDHVEVRLQSNRYQHGEYDIDEFPYAKSVIADGKVRGISKSASSFHPKLCLFLMRRENGDNLLTRGETEDYRIRLVISSRNLTKNSMLEGVLCLESGVLERRDLNPELVSLLRGICEIDGCNPVVEKLAGVDFSESAARIFGLPSGSCLVSFCTNEDQSGKKIKDYIAKDLENARKCRIVSPFLGERKFMDSFFEGILKDNRDIYVITNSIRKDILLENELPKDTVFRSVNGGDGLFVHAKIYAADTDNESVLYVGSANFSENGLKRNHELMCRLSVGNGFSFCSVVEEMFGELTYCSIDDSATEEIEGYEIPELDLSASERDALCKAMRENLRKTQLTEALRLYFGDIDADAPLADAIRRLVRSGETDETISSEKIGLLKERTERFDAGSSVRKCFNSPFYPFVLVTTSIGAEGLDFHQYCERLVHYTAPANVVALEQKNGRIDRYGSLAQRKWWSSPGNVFAMEHGFKEHIEASGGMIPGWDAGEGNLHYYFMYTLYTSEKKELEELFKKQNEYRRQIGVNSCIEPDSLNLCPYCHQKL
ncbi:MAG: hypothetical protein IJ695_10280 [Butyrivibrio sp.]|nr:hypothetical protein [Butyrivibrio sp.]